MKTDRSAIYNGTVVHARVRPKRHSLQYTSLIPLPLLPFFFL